MKHALHTDIEIDATPEAVWNILTDLDGYADWNPFITSATGTVAVGERLVNRMRPPGGREMPLKPTVTAVEPEATFEWLGHLGVSGVLDGRHRFELEQTPSGGTRLKHSEFFSGALVVLALLVLVFTPQLIALLYSGFSASMQAELVPMVRILLLQPLLLGVSNLFAAYVQVQGRFLLYALAPVLYNLGYAAFCFGTCGCFSA